MDRQCNKDFPSVSIGGYGCMFLWFCGQHGHCYGFHLISGGEGRKDPFCSFYKYMKDMPKDVFYDFACSQQGTRFFFSTRFWHDLFHSITHLCGPNFKSGRVLGLDGINTEISEQVNGYLQCVKYTASHLSQEHFMFFMQFFLYLLNKDKSQTLRKQAATAIAGQM